MTNETKAAHEHSGDEIRGLIKGYMEKHGVTIVSRRIPNRLTSIGDDKWNKQAMHAAFDLMHKGRRVYSGEYSAGEAHAMPKTFEGFLANIKKGRTATKANLFLSESEARHAFKIGIHGRRTLAVDEYIQLAKAGWLPDPFDIVQSLLSDATQESFESWCSDLGYGTDSKRADSDWQACRECDRVCRQILGADFEFASDLARNY